MSNLTRRNAIAGAGAGLLILKPKTAFGRQANSAVQFGTIGTGGPGTNVTEMMVSDRARLTAVCDIFPDRIDRAPTRIAAAANVPATKDDKAAARSTLTSMLVAWWWTKKRDVTWAEMMRPA
jgi:hypothetical protein